MMKYKFKIIDILLILMLPITFNDFKDGYFSAGVMDVIILYCSVKMRIYQISRGEVNEKVL